MSIFQGRKQLLAQMLTAIDLDRLVIFCGAGLSFGVVPTAGQLAAQCATRYDGQLLPVQIPANARDNLESLAEFLFSSNQKNLFIRGLVDWGKFHGTPKKGHLAVADFLCCHMVEYVVTTNYDDLIESASRALGEGDPEPSLDAPGIQKYRLHKPLLKIHGTVGDKDHTLWCKRQLRNPKLLDQADKILRQRINSSLAWLRASLFEKDLVFVGFWSDWGYFNRLFARYLKSAHGQSVVLVDPQPAEALRAKAPQLWAWAERHGANFSHIQESGDAFLDELRSEFSQHLLQKVLISAIPAVSGQPGLPNVPTHFTGATTDDMYALRRDFFGVPVGEVPRFKRPVGMDAVGRAHIRLRRKNAQLDGASYIVPGVGRIRIVNGQTKLLSEVKRLFRSEPPKVVEDDYVICAGAEDDGDAKPDIIREVPTGDAVRPGSSAKWLTLTSADKAEIC